MSKHLVNTITRQIVSFAVYPAPVRGQRALDNHVSLFLCPKTNKFAGAQICRRFLCELRIDLTLFGFLKDMASIGHFEAHGDLCKFVHFPHTKCTFCVHHARVVRFYEHKMHFVWSKNGVLYVMLRRICIFSVRKVRVLRFLHA